MTRASETAGNGRGSGWTAGWVPAFSIAGDLGEMPGHMFNESPKRFVIKSEATNSQTLLHPKPQA